MFGAVLAFSSCVPASAETPEDCFAQKTNALRRRQHRPTLVYQSKIAAIAERHSKRMAAEETIFHNNGVPPDDSLSIAEEVERSIGSFRWLGENVGMGADCSQVFDAFLGSSGHKQNLLDDDYEQFGVGVTRREDTIYVSISFFTPASKSVSTLRLTTPKKERCA